MMRQRRKQVLLVDDNRHARLFLAQILNAVDIEVQQAASGPEALKLLTEHSFDAVIADMYMQPMDGITLTREIRAMSDKAIRNLPIVMASAQASRAIVEGGRAVGVSGFVAKPFSAAAVLTRLESALAPRGVHYIDAPGAPIDPPRKTADTNDDSLAYI
jgi:two-component system chemotaxis response regulator CheY